MSIRLMSIVWSLDTLGQGETLVMLALADWANDDGHCYPSMSRLASKARMTDRGARAIIAKLCAMGLLRREEVVGKGVNYYVLPGTGIRGEQRSGGNDVPKTPEARSANTSRTVIPSEAKASSGRAKKRTTVPANFKPILTGKTGETVAAWPEGRLEEEVENFIDHHTAKGTLSTCWQASWRTWVRNSRKWDERDGLRAKRNAVGGREPDLLLAALERARDEERAEAAARQHQADDPGAWGSLPSQLTHNAGRA